MRADRRDEGRPDHRRASPVRTLGWRQSWRIARRDLHLGFRGLRLLFVCLFLGVAKLAAIGSLTSAITDELAARGQTLLGGDLEIAMTQSEASASEKADLGGLGAHIGRATCRGGVCENVEIQGCAGEVKKK